MPISGCGRRVSQNTIYESTQVRPICGERNPTAAVNWCCAVWMLAVPCGSLHPGTESVELSRWVGISINISYIFHKCSDILCILIIKIYNIHLDLSYIYYYMKKQNFENLIFSGTMLRCGSGYLWLFEWIFIIWGGFREYMLGLTALPRGFSCIFPIFTRNYSITRKISHEHNVFIADLTGKH